MGPVKCCCVSVQVTVRTLVEYSNEQRMSMERSTTRQHDWYETSLSMHCTGVRQHDLTGATSVHLNVVWEIVKVVDEEDQAISADWETLGIDTTPLHIDFL